jgi:hypothetical protein
MYTLAEKDTNMAPMNISPAISGCYGCRCRWSWSATRLFFVSMIRTLRFFVSSVYRSQVTDHVRFSLNC